MGHAVFVFGAAGAGKTTFSNNMREKGRDKKIRLINLDPAQKGSVEYDVDLCEYITVDEVMEEQDYGPNGALFYSLEEMCQNIDELHLQDFEDEYFFFDCPGQIELFLHSDIMDRCIKHVQNFAKVAVVYLIDSMNFKAGDKYLYNKLCATMTASRLLCPIIPILTKCDLLTEEEIEEIMDKEDSADGEAGDEYSRLKEAIVEYVTYNGIVDPIPLNWENDDNVSNIFSILDNVLQRYDDLEPSEPTE